MATTSIAPNRLRPAAAAAPPAERTQTAPVSWWALIGGVCLAFEAYVMIRWVTGPYFKTVGSGPSTPPTWMKAILIAWQAVGIPVGLGILYWALVRPWRRERRITFDGLLTISCLLVVWQDPLSSYFNHWYAYNAYLINMGSWVKGIPGWMSYAAPGHMDLEPIIWTPFLYIYFFFAAAVFGCWVMRKAHQRRPQTGNMSLLLCAFAAGMVCDIIGEGLLIMPAGVYTYAGGHLAIFPHAYHKFPITEAITVGALFAGLSGLRYFKDDKGRTMVERGVDKLRIGEGRRNLLRFAAVTGMVNVLVMCCYNIPNGVIGAHSTAWPKDIQDRSYFTDGMCGQGTGRACPGPAVPLVRGNTSPFVTTGAKLGIPAGTKIPPVVPFVRHGGGPFGGPVF